MAGAQPPRARIPPSEIEKFFQPIDSKIFQSQNDDGEESDAVIALPFEECVPARLHAKNLHQLALYFQSALTPEYLQIRAELQARMTNDLPGKVSSPPERVLTPESSFVKRDCNSTSEIDKTRWQHLFSLKDDIGILDLDLSDTTPEEIILNPEDDQIDTRSQSSKILRQKFIQLFIEEGNEDPPQYHSHESRHSLDGSQRTSP